MGPEIALDATHDPALQSWVEPAHVDDCDFPLQNLPFGDCTGTVLQDRPIANT
jgi:hypothetical protein